MTDRLSEKPGLKETNAQEVGLPEIGLVVLCGASGSGKSTFARKHFSATEVISSDQCRAMVGDDETDQSITRAAFELLHEVVDKRLQLGRMTVVDATNVKPEDRRTLTAIAKRRDLLASAIVFDTPLRECLDRNQNRTDRQTPPHAIKRHHSTLRRTKKTLRREFSRVHTVTPATTDRIEIVRQKLWNDRQDDAGPFDLIGDVHGCADELETLLKKLGYDTDSWLKNGEAVRHPEGRRVLFLGDLVDRGPGSDRVLDMAMAMVEAGTALCIMGNHENKLMRALRGAKVQVRHGLAETLEQLSQRTPEFRDRVEKFLSGLISHYVLDNGRLVIAHAGLPENYHGRASGRVRSFAMYGDTTGETDEFGLPVRYPWAEDYRGSACVVYGHTPVPTAEWINNTICLDTGCVFGGELTAMRWPEKELVSTPAEHEYYAPVVPLVIEPEERPPLLLDVQDVMGKRYIETSLTKRLSIDADRSSAALEVMSRFAVDPRWLVYLPPTMAPVATSSRADLLEHPDEAFRYYQHEEVSEVVCEEKHMGSRAVVVIARDSDAAQQRFGISNEAAGVVVTRTGRPFFSDESLTGLLLSKLRSAIDAAGWWEEFDSSWFVFDAELLPWSAKAGQLLEQQYAPVGAAGRTMLSAASQALQQAVERGVDVSDIADRTSRRQTHLDAYTSAYRQYCWDVDGLDGIQLAPFQLLAAEGDVLARRPHSWHLEKIDQLVSSGSSGFFRQTERRFVNLADTEAVAEATTWWEQMTAKGGEGMVVKPADSVVKGKKGLVLPGVKCRGREYLRIIYGPEYLEPENLDRLRSRSLGRKSSLARREFALGVEALDRFVHRKHLFQVHECVFAILALEGESVDPRL